VSWLSRQRSLERLDYGCLLAKRHWQYLRPSDLTPYRDGLEALPVAEPSLDTVVYFNANRAHQPCD